VVCAALLLGGVAAAQGPVDAGIRGHVCEAMGRVCMARVFVSAIAADDPSDGGAVGARVTTITAEREVEVNRAGDFLVQRLPPGEYRVRVSSGGVDRTAVVSVEGGELADVVIPATAGGSGWRAAEVLQRKVGSLVVPEAEADVSTLPLAARRWEDAGELDSQAAVVAAVPESASGTGDEEGADGNGRAAEASGRDGAAASGLSYGGIAPIQGAMTVDGLSAEQNFRAGPRGAATGGPSSGSSYSQGALRGFRVLPRTFSAQYGGGGGGLAVVSRAGATGVHGNAFAFVRDSSWAATNPFSLQTQYRDGVVTSAAVKPGGSMEEFGGALGGPLRLLVPRRLASDQGRSSSGVSLIDTLVIFASVEAQLHDDKIISTPATANFYALSAEQIALLGNRGVGASATNAALNYLDSLSGVTARNAYRVQEFGRVDAAVTPHDRMALSYAGNRFNSPAGIALGQASDAVVARGRGSLGDSYVDVDAVAGRWLHVFSDRWNNEMRAQFARDLEYETPHAPLAQEPAIGPGGYAPQVSIGPNGFAYGTPAALAWGAVGGQRAYPDEARIEVADAMQLRIGKNLLSLGGDWSRIHDRVDTLRNAEGAFDYDSGTTNGKDGGLVDWITDYTFNVNAYPNGGCPSIRAAVHDFCFRSFTQSFGSAQTEFVTHTVAAFVEDSLRVRKDLTITAGVRFEYTLLPFPQTENAELDGELSSLVQPVNAAAGLTRTFPEDRNNFGPRLSAAWAPHAGKRISHWAQKDGALFTVHVGYGLFFGRIPGATVRAALTDTAMASTTLRVRIRPTTETLCPQVTAVQQGFGYPCDYTSAPPAAVAQTSSAMVFAAGYRVPAVQRATIAIDREIGQHTLLRLSYATAMAEQLPGSTDINIAPSPGVASFVLQGGGGHAGLTEGQTFVVPLYTQRLLRAYGPVTSLVSNSNATYHSATAELRLNGIAARGLRALELRGSYTFSRAIDYGPQSSAVPGVDGQFDPYRNGYDKGLSNQQFPQRFTGDAIYRTSWVRGPEWLRSGLRDWRFAAIGIAGSGAPYSYQIFGGPYLSGGRESINGSGGATYLPTIGRNTLRLPARGRVDLRVGRDFAVPLRGLKTRLNVFAEAFNLLNTVNVSAVETRAFLVGTPAYEGALTPLVFQDAATVAEEGLTTPAFGTPRSSTTGLSRERQVEAGVRMSF
jgi:hypothetical protein